MFRGSAGSAFHPVLDMQWLFSLYCQTLYVMFSHNRQQITSNFILAILLWLFSYTLDLAAPHKKTLCGERLGEHCQVQIPL